MRIDLNNICPKDNKHKAGCNSQQVLVSFSSNSKRWLNYNNVVWHDTNHSWLYNKWLSMPLMWQHKDPNAAIRPVKVILFLTPCCINSHKITSHSDVCVTLAVCHLILTYCFLKSSPLHILSLNVNKYDPQHQLILMYKNTASKKTN